MNEQFDNVDMGKIIELFENHLDTLQVANILQMDRNYIIKNIMLYYNSDNIYYIRKIILSLKSSSCSYKDVITSFEKTLKVSDVIRDLGVQKNIRIVPLLVEIL